MKTFYKVTIVSFVGLIIFPVFALAMNTTPVFDQNVFRWRNDDGNETTATWIDIANTNITGQAKNVNVRLRIQTAQTASQDQSVSVTPLLEYKAASGGACSDTSGWTTITTSTTNAFALIDSSQFTEAVSTTNQLGSIGGSTFQAGELLDQTNPASAVLSNAGKNFSEHEWNFTPTSNASALTPYIFRLSDGTNNTNYNAYTVCPQLTTAADAPTVSSSAATSVDFESATLNGSISATGGQDATQHGFVYSTDSTLSTGVSTTTLGSKTGTGSFNESISGLDSSQTYYFRAYATNGGGTGYGSILNFTTDNAPPNAPTVDDPLGGWMQTGNSLTITGMAGPALTTLSSSRVALIDESRDNLETYDFDGTDWSQIGNSLLISSSGATIAGLSSSRVAFYASNIQALRTYDFDGTDWSQTGNDLTGLGNNGGADIVPLSSSRIAYIDQTNDQLRTYDFDGTDWSQTGNSLAITNIISTNLTALSSSRIGFIDSGNDQLRTYDFDGTDWSQTGNSLAISGPSRPIIATLSSSQIVYIDDANDQLRTYDFDGTDWSQTGSSLAISVYYPFMDALSSSRMALAEIDSDELRTYDFTASTTNTTPIFKMTTTDPDSDNVTYEVNIYTTTDCSGAASQTHDQSSDTTGWSASSYTSGTQGVYQLQAGDALSSGTSYSWRARAKDPTGSNTFSGYSSCSQFETEAGVSAPTVTTSAATSVGVNSATLNGSIDATGGQNATQHGFAVSKNSTLDTGVSTSTLGSYSGTGSFNEATTTLDYSTTYYFRAYATNGGGTDYGNILNFTTNTPTASISLDVSNFAYGSIADNTASSTLTLFSGAGIIATNDSGTTEDFDIYGANTANWTLAGTTGSDQYVHQFCQDTDNDCTSPPTNYTALTTSPQTLKNSVANSGTVAFQLRIITPNPSTVYTQQSAVVTVQASIP